MNLPRMPGESYRRRLRSVVVKMVAENGKF